MVIHMHIHLYCTNGLCLGVLDWHTNSITYSERYVIAQAASYDVRDRDPLHFGWCMYTCTYGLHEEGSLNSFRYPNLSVYEALTDFPLCMHVMQTNTMCLHVDTYSKLAIRNIICSTPCSIDVEAPECQPNSSYFASAPL